jgi:hypothetical protein
MTARLPAVALALCTLVAAAGTATPAHASASACAPLGSLATQSSFGPPLHIVRGRVLRETVGRQVSAASRGVELLVSADATYDARAVEAMLRCRAASALAAGSDDPLALAGLRIHVEASRGLHRVRIEAPNRSVAAELARRLGL